MTRTIRLALAAGTLLMVGATLFAVSGKGGDSEMHAPVYSDKLVEAKLGPTTFAFPMNLYTHQTGPDFQGNVSLTMRWPRLEAFPPGAWVKPEFKRAYMDETIAISPRYVDKVPIDSLLKAYVDASFAAKNDPLLRIEERHRGEESNGLTPYVADLAKVAAYFQAEGTPLSPERIVEISDDWFVARNKAGEIITFISCDNSAIKGASLKNGRLENTPPGVSRGQCHHYFVIPERKISISLVYLRAYLPDWKRIQERVLQLISVAAAIGERNALNASAQARSPAP